MTDDRCLNCNAPATDVYDLKVRGNEHEGVALCEACHEAIQREIATTD